MGYRAAEEAIPIAPKPLSDIAPGMLVADDPALAASTVVPKGGVPYQPNIYTDQALEDFRKLAQPVSEHDAAVKRQIADDRSSPGNIVQSHMTTVGNAILAAPSIAGDVLSYPFRKAVDVPRGRDTSIFGVTPRVGVEDIAAGMRSLKGGTVEQARHNIDVNEAARREVYPTASTIGDVTGTVQTLASLRAPFTSKLRDFEYGTTKQMNKGKTLYESAPFKDTAEFRNTLMQSPGFNSFMRGAGRTAEAGLEGTALGLLQEGDPATAAAFSAGTQGLTSAGSEVLMRKFVKLPSRVATFSVNAAILSGVFYAMGQALPGIEFKDYEAQKAAIHKMLLGYTMGAGLSLVGARARSGPGSVAMPHLTDALASAPRNAMQKVMVDYLNSDAGSKAKLGEKIRFLSENLGRFTDQQLKDASAAFNSGNVDRFYKQLDRIQETFQ